MYVYFELLKYMVLTGMTVFTLPYVSLLFESLFDEPQFNVYVFGIYHCFEYTLN